MSQLLVIAKKIKEIRNPEHQHSLKVFQGASPRKSKKCLKMYEVWGEKAQELIENCQVRAWDTKGKLSFKNSRWSCRVANSANAFTILCRTGMQSKS